jgi:hypothetical protein
MGENTVIKSSMVKTLRVDSKLNSGYVKKKKSKLELTWSILSYSVNQNLI